MIPHQDDLRSPIYDLRDWLEGFPSASGPQSPHGDVIASTEPQCPECGLNHPEGHPCPEETGGQTSMPAPPDELQITADGPNAAHLYGASVWEDYQGSHRAPGPDFGAPLHALNEIYPDDVYGSNAAHLYGHGGNHRQMDRDTVSLVQGLRGQPDTRVPIYRAAPAHVTAINPGDWVTPNPAYAQQHLEGPLGGEGHVLTNQVPARELWTNADSIHEYGWHPEDDWS